MDTQNLTIYLADDHTLFRKGMIRLLESMDEISILDEAENGRRLIELVKQRIPDMVLLDVRMPEMDGIETCVYLHQHYPKIKVIMLSMESNVNLVDELLCSGAMGYLRKEASTKEVFEAIHTVANNKIYIDEGLASSLSQREGNTEKISNPHNLLTERELEVLALTCSQYPMKQIADILCISVRTVHNHRRNMMQKIGVKNVTGLVMYAKENQLSILRELKYPF